MPFSRPSRGNVVCLPELPALLVGPSTAAFLSTGCKHWSTLRFQQDGSPGGVPSKPTNANHRHSCLKVLTLLEISKIERAHLSKTSLSSSRCIKHPALLYFTILWFKLIKYNGVMLRNAINVPQLGHFMWFWPFSAIIFSPVQTQKHFRLNNVSAFFCLGYITQHFSGKPR